MTLQSDWQMGQNLEWYTQLPVLNRPRESPVFIFQNTECYFEFCIKNDSDYYLYLKPKTTGLKLESFPLVIYSDHYGTDHHGIFYRQCVNVSCSGIYTFSSSAFSKRGQCLVSGHFIRFCFVFQNGDRPLLSLEKEKESDEKSTQADLMVSLQTDVECLSSDFGEMMKNGDHSDVQLLCNGGNIPAHKAILAARSETFSGMFRDSTEENKAGLMNLTTIEKSVMELCLEFIYKGKIITLPVEKAADLYVLGHVFKIPSLTKVCADLMIHNLCADNYISYLVCAYKNDDYFNGCLIDYISDHLELLKSESWIKFSEEYVKTAIQVQQKGILNLI